MKELLIALCAILAVASARPNQPVTIEVHSPTLYGSKVCTRGPGYWCQNITTSAGCHATKHCINSVWKDMQVPEDTDSVCTICKDMVLQARNQLESNETQEDLKAVFRGSCALIHIKPIIQECDKLVDNFVPELVETLASQMNPSVVCSVAGLCNSKHIDRLLEEYENGNSEVQPMIPLKNDEYQPDECSKCYTITTHMESKFKNSTKSDFVHRLLDYCGLMNSFSDSCASIVLTYSDPIYDHYKKEFNADNICHLSGKCSDKFHVHDNDEKTLKVEIRPLSSVGMVEVNDDLPCKLCEQLVSHLRDLLVANTTESEFKLVLQNLCKQTKSFTAECVSIVNEYYSVIYSYLTKELDGKLICEVGGICPAKNLNDGPVMPLVSDDALSIGLKIANVNKNQAISNPEASDMQLPLERMNPSIMMSPNVNVQGQTTCSLCEYILHYIQEVITDPSSEKEIKTIVEKVCTKIPKALEDDCEKFVESYGDALVAVLATQLDPGKICSMFRLCPTSELLELVKKIPREYTVETEIKKKPTCPLCLLAVQALYNAIRNNKTEKNIIYELDKLCSHFPESLNDECKSFVKGYSKELIEKLLDDMRPQEICEYIKLCNSTPSFIPNLLLGKEGEIMTNEIPDYAPVESAIQHTKSVNMDIECTACETVMKYVEHRLSNKNTRDEIEKVIHDICEWAPEHISEKCNKFVDTYGDAVISLLADGISPKQVCIMISLCSVPQQIKESVTECAVCRAITSGIDEFLNDEKTDEEIEIFIAKVCNFVPAFITSYDKCNTMVTAYGRSMINIIKRDGAVDRICTEIAKCDKDQLIVRSKRRNRREVGVNKRCTWGPQYYCANEAQATECKAVEYCENRKLMNAQGEVASDATKP